MGKEWNGKGYYKKNNLIYELKGGTGFIKNKNYKGEYLNGEKNGKWKEYKYIGKLIFEGEYLKGERLKGKEYDDTGGLLFGRWIYSSSKKW